MFCIIYRESNSHYSCRSQTQSIADKTEYIKQISGLLGSKDFRERIKGIDQLAADCQSNPNMVINSIFPVSTNIFALSWFSVNIIQSCVILKTQQNVTFFSFPSGLPSFRCLMPSRPGCRSPTARSTCTPSSLCRRSSTC